MRTNSMIQNMSVMLMFHRLFYISLFLSVIYAHITNDKSHKSYLNESVSSVSSSISRRLSKPSSSSVTQQQTTLPFKTVISYTIYAPHANDTIYQTCLSNVDFFLRVGVVDDANVQYVFNLVPPTPVPHNLTLLNDSQSNIEIIFTKSYTVDLFAHGDVIDRYSNNGNNNNNHNHNNNSSSVDLYIFLNCGCVGPFYRMSPTPAPLKPRNSWIQSLKDKLVNGIHLIGPTISCEFNPHVQSYAMAMTPTVAKIAQSIWHPLNLSATKDFIVESSEVGFSKLILDKGYHIASLDSRHLGRDFHLHGSVCDIEYPTLISGLLNPTSCRYWREMEKSNLEGDWGVPGCLGLDPCEVMFVKDGGEILRQHMHSRITLKKVSQELSHLSSSQPYMCTHKLYPFRPFLQTESLISDMLTDEMKNDITNISPNLIMTFFVEYEESSRFLSYLSNNKNSSFPPHTLIMIFPEDKITKEKIFKDMKNYTIIQDQTLYSIVLEIPNQVYDRYSKYVDRLCFEECDRDDIKSVMNCIHPTPLRYYLTDSMVKYVVQYKNDSKRLLFQLNTKKFVHFQQSIPSLSDDSYRVKNDNIDIVKMGRHIIEYSLPTRELLALEKIPLHLDLIPKRPTVEDYRNITESYIIKIANGDRKRIQYFVFRK